MFIVHKDEAQSPALYTMSGVVDEAVDFPEAIGPLGLSADFNSQAVSRINSVGIKLWSEFFQGARAKGCAMRFFELSPALVGAMNLLPDFILSSEVQSVCAPFFCASCKKGMTLVANREECKALLANGAETKCVHCGAQAELDEIPEEYFSFVEA